MENLVIGCAQMIKLLFFAQLSELAGCDSTEAEFQNGLTPRMLVDQLESDMPAELIEALRFDAVMVSVNKVMAGWDDTLSADDEVAFLPPFSGG